MTTTDPYTITPHDIEVIGYCRPDAWTIHHVDSLNGRRLTIKPWRVKVSRSDFGRGARRRIAWNIYVEGRVIRQADGELTTHRRGIMYHFPQDGAQGYTTALVDGGDRLDPEIIAFANRARRIIEAGLEAEAAS